MIKHDVKSFRQTKSMCGPYAIKQVCTYFGDEIEIQEIIRETKADSRFGTNVGRMMSFLQKRYKVDLYTNSLAILDLSWKNLSPQEVVAKLQGRKKFKKRNIRSYDGFIEYFSSGGHISFEPITKGLIKKMLDDGEIVLIRVSSPYYYSVSRKYRGKYDDIRGKDWGHYLVVAGYDKEKFYIVDPGPCSKTGYDWVDADKVIASILTRKPYIAGLEKV